MIFNIITIFPEIFKEYVQAGILGRASKLGLLDIQINNLRDYTEDKNRTVDDKPFGGGMGMVMKVEPFLAAILELKRTDNSKIITFSPSGKKFNQSIATQLSKVDQLIVLCGRYEGIDERVSQNIADEELSIGDYVLMGGEIPAMTIIESVSRLIPGVVGKEKFLEERIDNNSAIEYPQFTRPAFLDVKNILSKKNIKNFKLRGKNIHDLEWGVPEILLSGDHSEILKWRKQRERKIE